MTLTAILFSQEIMKHQHSITTYYIYIHTHTYVYTYV